LSGLITQARFKARVKARLRENVQSNFEQPLNVTEMINLNSVLARDVAQPKAMRTRLRGASVAETTIRNSIELQDHVANPKFPLRVQRYSSGKLAKADPWSFFSVPANHNAEKKLANHVKRFGSKVDHLPNHEPPVRPSLEWGWRQKVPPGGFLSSQARVRMLQTMFGQGLSGQTLWEARDAGENVAGAGSSAGDSREVAGAQFSKQNHTDPVLCTFPRDPYMAKCDQLPAPR
jgi:hypothetical protein